MANLSHSDIFPSDISHSDIFHRAAGLVVAISSFAPQAHHRSDLDGIKMPSLDLTQGEILQGSKLPALDLEFQTKEASETLSLLIPNRLDLICDIRRRRIVTV